MSESDLFISTRSKPLCKVPEISFGSMPNDGGNFLFTEIEKNEFIKLEPGAEKYIRELISADEFLNGRKRFCLWLVNANPTEIKTLPKILERVESVRALRSSSSREATQKLALTPSEFGEIRQPLSEYILIPRHSSENRLYIPIGFLGPEKIVSDSCLFIQGALLFHFGILTSKMHMTWVKYTCGRIKSDFRYSNTIVYNNYPWPGCGAATTELSGEAIVKIEAAAQAVLDARAQFPSSSLADLYDPLTMPPVLVKAHTALDRAVDVAYGYRDTGLDADRIAFLFNLYKVIVKI